jgi:hypothetical protein
MIPSEYSEKYFKWVEWNKKQKNPIPPMTTTQSDFANWLFENAEEQLSQLGNLESIFKSVQIFIKENNRKNKYMPL